MDMDITETIVLASAHNCQVKAPHAKSIYIYIYVYVYVCIEVRVTDRRMNCHDLTERLRLHAWYFQ